MSIARKARREQQKLKWKAAKGDAPTRADVSGPSNVFWNLALAFFVGAAVGAGILFAFGHNKLRTSPMVQNAASPGKLAENQLNVEDLAAMSDAQLAGVDIARVNLLCAESLLGRNNMNIEDCLRVIDRMAEAARLKIARNRHRFIEKPSEYENSEIYFQVGMLVMTLGKDLGVHYNPKKTAAPTEENRSDLTFFDSADDVFISGMLTGERLGTCASMPVLCVAVGRRLGYPLKLVSAKGHLFFRWDDGREKMNFECTNRINIYSDDHYKNWPYHITDGEIAGGWYLRSLTPRQELSVFLNIRSCVLLNSGRVTEALLAQAQAALLNPGHPYMEGALASTVMEQAAKLGVAFNANSNDAAQADPLSALRAFEAINAFNRSGAQRFPPNPYLPNLPFLPPSANPFLNR